MVQFQRDKRLEIVFRRAKRKIEKLKIIILLFLSLSVFPTEANSLFKRQYQVYDPLWSVEQNGGNSPLNSLTPLRLISDEDKVGKMPLVLVHGVISERRTYCNWKFLIDEIDKPENETFRRSHPIYIFRYPSGTTSYTETMNYLDEGLKELLSDYPPETNFKVIVSSLGGCLLCGAVSRDKALASRIIKGISLGTPFWGTPLLNKELIIDKAEKNQRFFNSILFQTTNIAFPGLSSEVYWKLPLKKDVKESDIGEKEAAFCAPLREKIATYGAYILSPAVQKGATSQEEKEWLIKKIQTSDYRHSWDAVMHYKLGAELHDLKPIYLFSYNDGLVPIYSSLWLNPSEEVFMGKTYLNENILNKIKEMNPKARLFAGIDHSSLTSLDRSIEGDIPLRDLLSGSTDPIAQLIIKDLK